MEDEEVVDEFQFVLSLLCFVCLLPCFVCFCCCSVSLSCDRLEYIYIQHVLSFTPPCPFLYALLSFHLSTSSFYFFLLFTLYRRYNLRLEDTSPRLILLFSSSHLYRPYSLVFFCLHFVLSCFSFLLFISFVYSPSPCASHIPHSTTPLSCRINTSSFSSLPFPFRHPLTKKSSYKRSHSDDHTIIEHLPSSPFHLISRLQDPCNLFFFLFLHTITNGV